MKRNSLLIALGRFVSEAGAEQSTNFRWWDFKRTRCVLACRLDLNHPPTAVGGISEFRLLPGGVSARSLSQDVVSEIFEPNCPLAKIGRAVLLLVICLSAELLTSAQTSSLLRMSYRSGDFKLVYGGQAADIVVSSEDFKVVHIASADFAADVERVTGKKTLVRANVSGVSKHAVVIGTLGKNPLIDALASRGKLDVAKLKGQWESFLIATVPNPFPGVMMGLVVVGSDRRGTAYGVYELSQAIGISPWNWWADVAPERRNNLVVAAGMRRFGPPSVRYRGIFLNDEDWGLQPWAARTYEPERGDIGPKTYARIFELLLRLKANTVWPAMHACTRPFNGFPENKQVADDYAIVMGSSHAEPMLRNNVGEWKAAAEEYDYTKNPGGVRKYWEDRVAENGRFENIYTLGMRGIHDSPIQGPKTARERIALLEKIFGVQRDMIAKFVTTDLEHVPQIFCPYKEVLADYRSGLEVPDDVTIVWPDDNFGYIRYFPTAEERKRTGGFGVYYHISYLGRPLSYLWLNTTPPSLVWEEMSKAYEHGVRKLWMLNVGDLKPAEIGIEFFMQMAWDISRWRRDNLSEFLVQWAQREFGAESANDIARIMNQYYKLGFVRRPEHLQWYLPNEKPRPSVFSSIDYGDETQSRLDAYDDLQVKVGRLYEKMPSERRNAFYELVVYPVRVSALANRRFFLMEKSALYAKQGRASAAEWARRAEEAGVEMATETAYYNETLADGKWRYLMSMEMTPGQWPSMRTTTPVTPQSVSQMRVPEPAGLGVAIEGRLEPVEDGEKEAAVPALNVFTRDRRFVDVFNTGRASARWTATSSDNWIKLSQTAGDLREDARIWVSIDWRRAPKGERLSASIEIKAAGSSRMLRVPVWNLTTSPESVGGFVESSGVVAMEAEHFSRKLDRAGVGWNVIPNLGRSGDSVSVFPTTTPSIEPSRIFSDSPALQYDFHLFTAGDVKVICYLVPTHPLQAGRGLRFAIGFDNQTPKVVTVGAGMEVPSSEWSQNVLNATTLGATTFTVNAGGSHILKLYMVDPGVIVDRLIVDSGGLRPSYLGPVETRVARR